MLSFTPFSAVRPPMFRGANQPETEKKPAQPDTTVVDRPKTKPASPNLVPTPETPRGPRVNPRVAPGNPELPNTCDPGEKIPTCYA